jgi:hypothetical protein
MRIRWMLLTVFVLTGCRSRKADLGMSDSAFVQVMSELKVVADYPNLTPAVRAQRREAVLRKRRVTADQLEKLDATLASHPNHAKLLWAAIEQKAVKETPKDLR